MHQREVEQHDHLPMTAAEEAAEREELERDRERLWAMWHALPENQHPHDARSAAELIDEERGERE